MNLTAIKKVIPHLAVMGVVPTNIAFDVKFDQNGSAENQELFPQTFSRFQWGCVGQGDRTVQDPVKGIDQYLVILLVRTLAEIAFQPEAGPIPEAEPIPEDLVLSTIEVTFAVTYQSDVPADMLDVEGMQEFIQHNVPYHFWPYWRELIQNLAIRSQLPVPNLPPYRVPEAAQIQTKSAD